MRQYLMMDERAMLDFDSAEVLESCRGEADAWQACQAWADSWGALFAVIKGEPPVFIGTADQLVQDGRESAVEQMLAFAGTA